MNISKTLIGACWVHSGSVVIADPAYLDPHVTWPRCIDDGRRTVPLYSGNKCAGVIINNCGDEGCIAVYAVRDESGDRVHIEIDFPEVLDRAPEVAR